MKKKNLKLTPKAVVLIVAAAILAVLLILGTVYVVSVATNETVFPNVYAAGINLGDKTPEDAAAALDAYIAENYGEKSLTVQFPDGRTATVSPEALGVHFDTAAIIKDVMSYGRDGNLLQSVLTYTRAKYAETAYTATTGIYVSEDGIRGRVSELADAIHCDMRPSVMDIRQGEDLIIVTVGTTGVDLDQQAAADAITRAVYDNRFEEPVELSCLYTPYPALDLTPVYQELHRDVSDAYYDPEAKEIVDEQIGYGFDLVAANQQIAMSKDGEKLLVRMAEILPEETRAHLEEIYFSDVLGTCETNGLGGYNRVTNITLVCQTINGYVLSPGETFSYNGVVGQRTAAKGYKEAGAYSNGEHVTEIGGGICQVSSTIYYAALKANLQIVSRTAHMFPVAYLPKGLDATVSWGGPDFQFRNNTDYPIRIEAKVEGGYCKIKLVGTKTDTTYVKMRCETLQTFPWKTTFTDDPEEVRKEGEHDGYYVVTYRQVYDENGNMLSEKIEAYSMYDPENIVLLNEDYERALEEERQRREEEERQRQEEEERQQQESGGIGSLIDSLFGH